jgi:hypothetical protein
MEKGADQVNLKRAPLCCKLHNTPANANPFSLFDSFALSIVSRKVSVHGSMLNA